MGTSNEASLYLSLRPWRTSSFGLNGSSLECCFMLLNIRNLFYRRSLGPAKIKSAGDKVSALLVYVPNVSLLIKLELFSCFPKAPRRPRLKRPFMLDERFGNSKKSWWFTLTPRSRFFLEKCEWNSFHSLLSLTPLIDDCGISYSALPCTSIGSPAPPDLRFKRIPALAILAYFGTTTDEEMPFAGFEERGDEVWSAGLKKDVPKGVAKAAAWSFIVGALLVSVAGCFWNKISLGVVGLSNIP